MKRLECAVQQYSWGKVGSSSFVARLSRRDVDETKPYAELWMGTHSNGPSKLRDSSLTLFEHINQSNSLLGVHEGGDLRFLFKVLSVANALSIQVHPTKVQARELHRSDPKNYPDDNHKPEMAIALTPFEMLCGFRPAQEIVANLRAHSELLALIDFKHLCTLDANSRGEDERKKALQAIFTTIWSCHEIDGLVKTVVGKLEQKADKTPLEQLMLRLDGQFSGDVGVLGPLFLNHFSLNPGEAVFLSANEPHAYLSGDCVECMACSDNTIRAGLTPKFKDVPTLCRSLTYAMARPFVIRPTAEIYPGIVEYAPPPCSGCDEFVVHFVSDQCRLLPPIDAGSIVILVRGHATLGEEKLDTGDVFFVPRGFSAAITPSSDDWACFRAFTPAPNKKG